jgi:hypothetical protein
MAHVVEASKLRPMINLLYKIFAIEGDTLNLPRVMTNERGTGGGNAALVKGGNSAYLDLVNDVGKFPRNLFAFVGNK